MKKGRYYHEWGFHGLGRLLGPDERESLAGNASCSEGSGSGLSHDGSD